MITTKNVNSPALVDTYRNIVRLTGGLPRQCAHWLAMTAKTYKHQFAALAGFGKGDKRQSGAFFPGGYKM